MFRFFHQVRLRIFEAAQLESCRLSHGSKLVTIQASELSAGRRCGACFDAKARSGPIRNKGRQNFPVIRQRQMSDRLPGFRSCEAQLKAFSGAGVAACGYAVSKNGSC
jgi:hypothetical protein